ncbi:hypothetical protein JVT61DRAFT_13701 [Boletus reticuloceps]|uniref:Uncharacterized protein n=1 Tax=Boletus reticuloceps TaxID=495285 RepID=A0A8I2YWU7_9AGAM|nr:hypothetical protein JVT61DRAFT_13701 [Boletus reticuloceps]
MEFCVIGARTINNITCPFSERSPGDLESTTSTIDTPTSADNALHRYTQAIDAWRDQLVALKGLNDDLAAILRDQGILHPNPPVTFTAPLASVPSYPPSVPPPSLQLTSGSTNSTAVSLPKLAEAQAKLQACEAHLTTKQCELDTCHITLAHDGLVPSSTAVWPGARWENKGSSCSRHAPLMAVAPRAITSCCT